MTRKIFWVLIIILGCALAFSFTRAPVTSGMGKISGETKRDGFVLDYPQYLLKARYDPEQGLIEGRLTLIYRNLYSDPVNNLQFNLPAKALTANAEIKIKAVKSQDLLIKYNTDEDRLLLTFDPPLPPHQATTIEITFSTTVPESATRLGRFKGASMLAGWYPLLAPRKGGVWRGVARNRTFGDPYFADAAYYRVELELPLGYKVLASGRVEDVRIQGDGQTWYFTGEKPLREFCFAAGSGWHYKYGPPGQVELVLAGHEEGEAELILATALQALNFFQKRFGPYPYSYLHIARVPLADFAGMEYPGLILISTLADFSPSVVVHEVAHQWWYNLVGTDQVKDSWMDEGLAEYATLLFYRHHDPSLYRQKLAVAGEVAVPEPLYMDRTLEDYATAADYRQAVYAGGRSFWLGLEEQMGEERLLVFLARVQREYLFRRLDKEDLLRELKRIE